MNKMSLNRKMLVSIIILLMIASFGIAVNVNESNISTSSQSSVMYSNSPDYYIEVCCVENSYSIDNYNNYFQLPIYVEVWNKYLNPVNNSKVKIQIGTGSQSKIFYTSTKYTNIQGKVKFGFSGNGNKIFGSITCPYAKQELSVIVTALVNGKTLNYVKYFTVETWCDV